jgi:hypothetical protein
VQKVSFHGRFYYLQCGRPNDRSRKIFVVTARWYGQLPSVSGLASFLPVPVDGWKVSRPDKSIQMAWSR